MIQSFRLNYWRGEVLDFEMVFAPSLLGLRLVQAIHSEFRNELEVLAPGYWVDSVCYQRFQLYYRKLLKSLGVDIPVDKIAPVDRDRFFLSMGVKDGRTELSGLQVLLGYKAAEGESSGDQDVGPSTGRLDLDLLVTMQISGWSEIGWISENYGTEEVSLLIEQYWNLRSNKNKVSEAQKEKDRATVAKAISQNANMAKKIKTGRDQAMQTLLLKTGTAAMEIAKKKDAAARNSSSSKRQPPTDKSDPT